MEEDVLLEEDKVKEQHQHHHQQQHLVEMEQHQANQHHEQKQKKRKTKLLNFVGEEIFLNLINHAKVILLRIHDQRP